MGTGGGAYCSPKGIECYEFHYKHLNIIINISLPDRILMESNLLRIFPLPHLDSWVGGLSILLSRMDTMRWFNSCF